MKVIVMEIEKRNLGLGVFKVELIELGGCLNLEGAEGLLEGWF